MKQAILEDFCGQCIKNTTCTERYREGCEPFKALTGCKCLELQKRIENARKFAEDAGACDVTDALNGELEYPEKEPKSFFLQAAESSRIQAGI